MAGPIPSSNQGVMTFHGALVENPARARITGLPFESYLGQFPSSTSPEFAQIVGVRDENPYGALGLAVERTGTLVLVRSRHRGGVGALRHAGTMR